MQSMKGRVAIVTGAGKGLGKAYAQWLAKRGCAVVVNNRVHPGVPSSARTLVDQIVAEGGTACVHEGSVDDLASSQALVQTAIDQFGKLDILICNAGVMPEGTFAQTEIADFEKTVNANLWGSIFPLRAAWGPMLERGYGRVVLSGSAVGLYGHDGVGVYGATRSAVVGLARSVALEAPAGSDIGVNVILPLAYTPMSATSMDRNPGRDSSSLLPAEKVATAVGWLCSEQCRLTGNIFHSGGGRISRVAIVESASIPVEDLSMENVAALSFDQSLAHEPSRAGDAGPRMLRG